jgi:hypothetical protein
VVKKIGGAVVSDREVETLAYDGMVAYQGISTLQFSATLAPSQTNAYIGRGVKIPFRGSIVGFAISGASSATYQATVNGVPINTGLLGTFEQVTYNKGEKPFLKDDELWVRVTTPTTFVNGSQVSATLFVVLDPAKTI